MDKIKSFSVCDTEDDGFWCNVDWQEVGGLRRAGRGLVLAGEVVVGVLGPFAPAIDLEILSGQHREATTARLAAVQQTGPGLQGPSGGKPGARAFHASSGSREALGLALRSGAGQEGHRVERGDASLATGSSTVARRAPPADCSRVR